MMAAIQKFFLPCSSLEESSVLIPKDENLGGVVGLAAVAAGLAAWTAGSSFFLGFLKTSPSTTGLGSSASGLLAHLDSFAGAAAAA